jgi:predicted TIM-barrel fold metal-dependent hydrolase
MATPKIDAYTHVIPPNLLEPMRRRLPRFFESANMVGRRALYDLDARLRLMGRFDGYRQILTLASPALEEWAGSEGLALARLANDGMAELVGRHPDRFAGFAAAVMLEDVEGSIEELTRAVRELGALGVQIYTNVNGRPLDDPRFEPFFAAVAALDTAIWAHPTRRDDVADYAGELGSRYGINLKFGWPYETVVFMTRLIFSGLLDRHPRLRILTHHAGGFVPHVAGRLTLQHETPEQRRAIGVDERFDESTVLAAYRRFYGDIVFSGAHYPLRCALDFFGPDRLVFATDFPFGAEGGVMFVRETIEAVEELPDPELRHRLFEANARAIFGITG